MTNSTQPCSTKLNVTGNGTPNIGLTFTGSNIPAGGSIGQVLMKKSAADCDVAWRSLPQETMFAGSIGVGNGNITAVNVNADTYTAIPMTTITTNTGGGTWDPVNHTYTIPSDGVYFIRSSIRTVDNSPMRNIYQIVNDVNGDRPEGTWSSNQAGVRRSTLPYSRMMRATAGTKLKLIVVSDLQGVQLSDASLTITKLSN